MNQIIRIGMDTSKHFFQLHGVDTAEQPVLRRKLRRKEMVGFFAKLPPTEIGMEACGAAHYWGRVLRELGDRAEHASFQGTLGQQREEAFDLIDP